MVVRDHGEGPQPSARPRRSDQAGRRLLQRRDQVHGAALLGPDPLVEPRAFRRRADEGEHTHVGEVNSIPSTVGGGGTHADGKVPRFREEDFGLFSTYGPQEGPAVNDWPLGYDELEPYY